MFKMSTKPTNFKIIAGVYKFILREIETVNYITCNFCFYIMGQFKC